MRLDKELSAGKLLSNKPTCDNIYYTSPVGGIGRRARFRFWYLRVCGFDSHAGHTANIIAPITQRIECLATNQDVGSSILSRGTENLSLESNQR